MRCWPTTSACGFDTLATVECARPDLPARVEAIRERSTKTVRCLSHDDAEGAAEVEIEIEVAIDPVDIGTPGASARREFERRKAGRERRVRAKHPKIGGFLHAISDEPQSTTAWDKRAVGEGRVGNSLNELASDRLRVLHDRRIPGSRANIDHLAVTPTGVYVIDPRRYAGRPRLKVEGGLLRPRTEKLLVGTRNCTKLVDGVLKQMEVVTDVIGDAMPVHGVLCFCGSRLATDRRLIQYTRSLGVVAQEALPRAGCRRASGGHGNLCDPQTPGIVAASSFMGRPLLAGRSNQSSPLGGCGYSTSK